jgi:hypothetical protein
MSKQKKTGILILLTLVVAVSTVVATMHGRGQDTSTAQDKRTPTQREKLERRQKEHGKLFDGHHGPKLRDLAAQQQGDVFVWEEEPYVVRLPDKEASNIPFIQFAGCNADAIAVGTLTSETPHLTPAENFIFTDYEMTVEEVIKANAASTIQAGKIVITREGGTLRQGGRTFHADVEGFKPFALGNRYLLFLRYIPATDAYLAYANGSFRLDGDKIVALGKPPGYQSEDSATFINEARAVASSAQCAK